MSTTTRDSDSEILDELRGVFRDSLGVEPVDPITPTTRFFADLGLASIDAVVLGEELQKRYGRPLPFSDLLAELGDRTERDLTIGELVAFLRRNT
jgi:acyl carrier protein